MKGFQNGLGAGEWMGLARSHQEDYFFFVLSILCGAWPDRIPNLECGFYFMVIMKGIWFSLPSFM